jgi:16S rRNA (uracil1498-N3)-methyltransferase
MSERFFVHQPIAGERAELIGDEARHLASVMRAKVGEEVTLFDGSGAEFAAHITAIGKHTVELEVFERREISRELPFSLTLAVALPKGERQKWLIEKATELGVTRIVPLSTDRGVAQPTDSALDRLRRGVIEASKQCGRNRLLEIAPPALALSYFDTAPQAANLLIADPNGPPISEVIRSPHGDVVASIGPEGGFSPAEFSAAQSAGWQPISLGRSILRVETAAIAIASWAASYQQTNGNR